MQLSFSHIMKHWKRNPNTPGVAKVPGSRNVLLRFYPPQSALGEIVNDQKLRVHLLNYFNKGISRLKVVIPLCVNF